MTYTEQTTSGSNDEEELATKDGEPHLLVGLKKDKFAVNWQNFL